MIHKLINDLKFLRQVNIFQFFYYNYFCKSIIRKDNSKIIPYRHVILDIDPTAKIILEHGDLEIGHDRIGKSKKETLIRLRENAQWILSDGAYLSYGSTIEVQKDALLETSFFSINTNSVIVTAKNIHIGEDAMLGRNVLIYDSDHHRIVNEKGEIRNPSKSVDIGNHVWLTSNVTVLKGSQIGENSVIGANCVVSGTIPANSLVTTERTLKIRENFGSWDRKSPDIE